MHRRNRIGLIGKFEEAALAHSRDSIRIIMLGCIQSVRGIISIDWLKCILLTQHANSLPQPGNSEEQSSQLCTSAWKHYLIDKVEGA